MRYISHFLEGAAWEGDLHPSEAESAYRAALAVAPLARSASLRLTALLSAGGRVNEAAAVLDSALLADRPADDPANAFASGDGRIAAALLVRLREGIK